MKILDRYVLLSFLRNYLIAMMTLIGMFVVLDMVFNFDELVELRGQAQGGAAISTFDVISSIADYYAHQCFYYFVFLSGIIPVVAAAFTLIRMTRFNELSAILAAGVPLLRVAAPIVIAAAVLQVLLIVDQEVIIPRITHKLVRDRDRLSGTASGESRGYRIEMIQDDRGALLTASRYFPPAPDRPARMREVDLIERDADLLPVAHVTADTAEFDASRQAWKLTNGRRVTGLQPEMTRSPEEPVDDYKSNITPDEIALWKSGDFVNLLSTERINEMLARRTSYGALELQRVKHARFTQWIMNIILLLLAIPFVLVRQPQELRNSILKCLVVVGVCMAGIFLAYQIAGRPPHGPQWVDRWPAIWAWVPILVFGPVALVLLDRLYTKAT
jgi:lipopolysaccharide export system permease protein